MGCINIISPQRRTTLVTILGLSVTILAVPHKYPAPQQHSELTKRLDSISWAVIGDSWASGVAYNSSNVYGPTDGEFCYRTKEAWGAQMATDTSWVSGSQDFRFAACGGTLMSDIKRQLENKTERPNVVWGIFGGNDAHFGAIARACIYQPYSLNHPLGWGPAWDQDPEGKGLCKQSITKAEKFLSDPQSMRLEFRKAINDVFKVAQDRDTLTFRLYVSSYIRFFDETTDDCDNWTFAHPRVSAGSPKVVKGLRKIINEKVLQVNTIQAEVIEAYELSPPGHTNYDVRNVQPDSVFDGHRFCEKGRTLEDQFYHSDLWLWNLQYYDEKAGEKTGTVKTDENGVMFMAAPEGFDVLDGYSTVLGADSNTDAVVPEGSDLNTQQYGFGWTARPFHPKFEGHKALKELFIQRMKDDHLVGVKPNPPLTEAPAPPLPPPEKRHECYGLGGKRYITREAARDAIEAKFCPEAIDKGPIERKYYEGAPDEVILKLEGPQDFRPSANDCIVSLLATLVDGCDGNDSKNPQNYKGGGKQWNGDIVYEVRPNAPRQPAESGKRGGCDATWNPAFNNYVVWGHGWADSDFGKVLKRELGGCALFSDSWSFSYGLGSDGREWTAKFRTGVFQRSCARSACITAGAPANFRCAGSG